MSETQSKELSISKIEHKILKNTFRAQSNSLRQKGRLVSADSSQLEPSVDNSHPYLEYSSISSLQSLQDILLPGRPEHTLQASASTLAELLRFAPAGAVITLPPTSIRLPSLHILNPVTLKGVPGSHLEIFDGSIVVDFSGQSKETVVGEISQTFVLCECTIQFTNTAADSSLFVMDSDWSSVEVRDCNIVAEAGHGAVCFLCNGSGYNKHATRAAARYSSTLRILSCDISAFAEVVRAGLNASVYIEKSHLHHCQRECLRLLNPRELVISHSVVERCGGSGLDLRVLPENDGATEVCATASKETLHRTVTIEHSDFKQIGKVGIKIWARKLTSSPVNCLITETKVDHAGKEGLALKHVVFNHIEVSSNDFSCNVGSGCWVQKVATADTRAPPTFSLNRCIDSCAGYGFYLYESGALLDNNEALRNKLGGIMIVGSKKTQQQLADVRIRRSVLSQNGDSGLAVMDFYNATVEVEHCKVTSNYRNGIYLLQSREVASAAPSQKDQVLPALRGSINVTNCTVSQNQAVGLAVNKFLCSVSNCVLTDNREGPYAMPEGSEKYLTWSEEVSHSASDKVCGSHKCCII